MNFFVFPPEINSALMYASAGAGPLLAAAAGWDGLAAELNAAAAQAEQAAGQARFMATSYEMAFAATVPPPLVGTNRSQLISLVLSNLFGQNASAIAATEAAYETYAHEGSADPALRRSE